MPVDLGLDDDIAAIKAVNGANLTWAAKIASLFRRAYHSDSNGFGVAAREATLDACACLPVGGMADYISTAVPDGFVECDGRSLSRTTYAALFAKIGVLHGSDSAATFKVPNARRRQTIGRSASLAVGEVVGSETVIMSEGNLPEHAHGLGGLAVADSGDHTHQNGGGYGGTDFFAMSDNTDYVASPSPQLAGGTGHYTTNGGTQNADRSNVQSAQAGAHTHAVGGDTDTAGASEDISVVSPSITLVKCIFTGVA